MDLQEEWAQRMKFCALITGMFEQLLKFMYSMVMLINRGDFFSTSAESEISLNFLPLYS